MPRTWREKIQKKMVRTGRIYILPTGRGCLFLSAMVIMILVAATYNNNLIFILAFLLFAVFFIGMLQTHFNLKGVRLKFVSGEEGFEGEPLRLAFHIFQMRRRPKSSLVIRCQSKRWKTLSQGVGQLSGREPFVVVRVSVIAWKRGVHPLPDVILETFYPLGLFRAWKVFRLPGEIVVYPKPVGGRTLEPVPFAMGEEALGLRTSPDGDFGELKNYLPGESYHQIAWKQFARSGNLYSKVHWGEEHRHYLLPWAPEGSPTELYLGQMSQWVRTAIEENATFGMDLPNVKIEFGSGFDHARLCWQTLARYREVG